MSKVCVSPRGFSWNPQTRSKISWPLPVTNFMQIGLKIWKKRKNIFFSLALVKCVFHRSNFHETHNYPAIQYAEIFRVEFHLIRTRKVESTGIQLFTLRSVSLRLFFTVITSPWRHFVKGFCTIFHENLKIPSVPHPWSNKTDRRGLHIWPSFFFIKNAS